MRVLLAPAEIAGTFSRLKKGLVELGHSATFIAPYKSPFQYGGIDPVPEPLADLMQDETIREIRWLEWRSAKAPLSWLRLKKWLLQKFWLVKNIVKFCRFASGYDAFVFHYGNSLYLKCKYVKFNDLFWLRLLGKPVIFLITGSEARPAYLDGAQFFGLTDQSPENLAAVTKATRDNNRAIDKYATYVVANKFTSHFFRRPVVPLQLVGNAVDVDMTLPAPPADEDGRPVIILHGPSRPEAKGTPEITRMIAELRLEGLNIDFRVVTGKTNNEVISEIRRCDFVVDQMYSDLALAVFAAEAACLGKPAVVGGYLTKEQLVSAYDHCGVPPSEFCHPSKMKDAIRRLITEPDYRRRLGNEAREYVTTYWTPRAVAERYLRLFRRDVPADWLWDPDEQDIAVPVCISAEKSGALISAIVEKLGEVALCLDEKPALKSNVLRLSAAFLDNNGIRASSSEHQPAQAHV